MALAIRIARLTCVSDSSHIFLPAIQSYRHCSSKPIRAKKNLARERVRENVKGYMFSTLFGYVKNYDKVLEKNFPSAVKVYRVFFDGVKDFFTDMKSYLKISRIANESPNGPRALNRKELELYLQMPRDMVKVAPTIILSSLPMVGYAVFPLAYMYPRHFLTSHFWTLQQKSEFQQIWLSKRLSQNRPVFRCLQSKLEERITKTSAEYEGLVETIGLLGSGLHPPVEQILKIKDAFASPPLDFNSLSSSHLKLLALMHGVPGSLFRRHRIAEHAFIIHFMDMAIQREGGVHNMQGDAIRHACYLRGLNPSNMSSEEMIEWLRNWVKVSMAIKEEHISLFLHLPILLGYNHPNNWVLIYGKH